MRSGSSYFGLFIQFVNCHLSEKRNHIYIERNCHYYDIPFNRNFLINKTSHKYNIIEQKTGKYTRNKSLQSSKIYYNQQKYHGRKTTQEKHH